MLPCSVIAAAGIFSCTTRSSSSSIRQAPSRSEYSECRWRWTKLDINWRYSHSIVEGGFELMSKTTRLISFDLVDDPRRDRRKQVVWQPRPVGRHAILALHRTD